MNPKLLTTTVITFLAAGAFVPRALSQEPETQERAPGTPQAQPASQARAVLEKALSASAQVRTASYRSRREILVPGLEGFSAPELTGTVIVQRGVGEAPQRFAVSGSMSGGGEPPLEFRVVYDGSTVRSTIGPEPVLHEAEQECDGQELRSAGEQVMVQDLLGEFEYAEHLAAAELELLEPQQLGDVQCFVVRAALGLPEATQVDWYIGQADHLVRGVSVVAENQGFDVTSRITLTDLKVGFEPAADAFAYPAPAGYEVKAYSASSLAAGCLAPDWELVDPDGVVHRLSDYRGKVVVMDFWATWCAPCKRVMPGMQKLSERYEGGDVAVFGVNFNDQGDALGYMKSQGFDYGLLLNAESVARDYRVNGIPAFFVIGVDGRILHSSVGADPKAEQKMARLIDAHLAANKK